MAICLNSKSEFFHSLDNMSVKELIRIKQHIEKLVEIKTPEDRKFIGALQVNDFVTYCPDFLNEVEIKNISCDLELSHKFDSGGSKTKSMWLSKTSLPYKWTSYGSGKNTVKQAIPIKDFQHIQSLLERINSEMGTSLNSCLIQFYPNGSSGIRLHDDFEWEMDQSQPFLNISIGESRKVEFLHNYQKASETPSKVVVAKNGSMYTMNKGCQNFFRHRVPGAGPNIGARFSLSFRRILDLDNTPVNSKLSTPCSTVPSHLPMEQTPTVPGPPEELSPNTPTMVVSPSAPPEELSPSAPPLMTSPSAPPKELSPPRVLAATAPPLERSPKGPLIPQTKIPPLMTSLSAPPKELSPPRGLAASAPPLELSPKVPLTPQTKIPDRRNITVLFGTSITRSLVSYSLSNRETEFINVSVSGARLQNSKWSKKIPDIATMVKDFAYSHPSKIQRVNRVVFSFGTNDIKFLSSKQLGPFREHICSLILLSRRLFGPNVKVSFQSVLPMRIMYTYTVENFLNFNRLLQNVCCGNDCEYLDWFGYFLDSQFKDINKSLYVDPFYLNRSGIAILNILFNQLHSNTFDPYI